MSQQNVKGATTKPTAASAQKDEKLSAEQVHDLFCYVRSVCGRTTGTIEPPDVPVEAEEVSADFGDFDSLAVWLLEGWPIAASDQMTMTHYQIER